MKEKIISIIKNKIKKLEECARGTQYSSREFWDGKIDELEELVEDIQELE